MKKVLVLLTVFLFLVVNDVYAVYEAPVDVTKMGITELLEAMDKGYLTSETLVNIYLERIEKYDGMFNSINQLNENAIEQARELDKEREAGNIKGRLHGIPILVKCNIDVYGMPTTAGAKDLEDNYPKENALAVQKLIDEGAIILGSTNMSEFAFSAATSYSSYGYVRNVFNTNYTPYGSSGGSGVAVKAGFAAASLGTDTNSSVRLPASGAGLVGIRPSYGLISSQGVIPYDYSRDTIGVISHTVADNALLLEIIQDDNNTKKFVNKTNESNLDGLNVGVAMQYVKGSSKYSGVLGLTDSEIYDLMEKSIKELEEAGANIIYLDDFAKQSNISIASSTYNGITMCQYFNSYIKGTTGSIRSFQQLTRASGHVQNLWSYIDGCENIDEEAQSKKDNKKANYEKYVSEYFDDYDLDVIVYPTLKNKVFAYNGSGNISPSSSLGSVIGYPSITVPMGFASDGFSYGIEFLSRDFDESTLYNVAIGFEKANGNLIGTSALTPSLYEISPEVIKLRELYEKELNNKQSSDWVREVRGFFKEYNTIEDKLAKAEELLNNYEKVQQSVNLFQPKNLKKIAKIVTNIMLLISFLIILRNLKNCFD